MSSNPLPQWTSFTKIWHDKPYEYISPSRTPLSAQGKNIVITGGGTGIGKAVAISYAEAGAKSVAILGRRIDRLETSVAATRNAAFGDILVLYQQADLTDETETATAFGNIAKQVGQIDILVNNVGALPPLAPFVGYDKAAFMGTFEVNVLTSFNAVQSFVTVAGSHPLVLNVTASTVHTEPLPGMSAYTVGKVAQLKMLEYFAAEQKDVRVIHVHPGIVDTEIGGPNPIKAGQDEAGLPGNFCVWLGSDEAKFLDGKLVWANWDAEELVARSEEIRESKLLTVHLNGLEM